MELFLLALFENQYHLFFLRCEDTLLFLVFPSYCFPYKNTISYIWQWTQLLAEVAARLCHLSRCPSLDLDIFVDLLLVRFFLFLSSNNFKTHRTVSAEYSENSSNNEKRMRARDLASIRKKKRLKVWLFEVQQEIWPPFVRISDYANKRSDLYS